MMETRPGPLVGTSAGGGRVCHRGKPATLARGSAPPMLLWSASTRAEFVILPSGIRGCRPGNGPTPATPRSVPRAKQAVASLPRPRAPYGRHASGQGFSHRSRSLSRGRGVVASMLPRLPAGQASVPIGPSPAPPAEWRPVMGRVMRRPRPKLARGPAINRHRNRSNLKSLQTVAVDICSPMPLDRRAPGFARYLLAFATQAPLSVTIGEAQSPGAQPQRTRLATGRVRPPTSR